MKFLVQTLAQRPDDLAARATQPDDEVIHVPPNLLFLMEDNGIMAHTLKTGTPHKTA